jgi:hypothetical protein
MVASAAVATAAAAMVVRRVVRVRKETDHRVETVAPDNLGIGHRVHREIDRHVHKANRVSVVRVRKETDHRDKEARAANSALRDHRVHRVSELHVRWEIGHHAHKVNRVSAR